MKMSLCPQRDGEMEGNSAHKTLMLFVKFPMENYNVSF